MTPRKPADAETLRAIRMRRMLAHMAGEPVPVAKPDPRLAICRGCHEAKTCPNAVKSGCCGGGYMFVYQVPCPHGRF